MGTPSGYLDRLAAPARGLARQVRTDPVGLHRNRPPPALGGARPYPREWPRWRTPRPASSGASANRPGAYPLLPFPHGPRLDPGLRADLLDQSAVRPGPDRLA